MKLFVIVCVKKVTNGYDVHVRRDGGNYIEFFHSVPTDVLEGIMYPEDLAYMLERDLDECGYFALREPDKKVLRKECGKYEYKKYDYIEVPYE